MTAMTLQKIKRILREFESEIILSKEKTRRSRRIAHFYSHGDKLFVALITTYQFLALLRRVRVGQPTLCLG